MKTRLLAKTDLTKILVATVTLMGLMLPGIAQAAQPYFQVSAGDVFAGGWFNTLSICSTDPGTYYQAPIYDSETRTYSQTISGGIQTWLKSGQGASTDLAAFALGDIQIDSQGANNYGFSSKLSFSNVNKIDVNTSGGDLEGTVPQAHCIPDYFNSLQKSPASFNGDLTTIHSSGQYTFSCPSPCDNPVAMAPSNVTIGVGQNTTVFLRGNAYINSDIKYAQGYNDSNVPKFVLVVLGSLYIGPNVKQLDGWYIAQPDASYPPLDKNDTGNIWTCHENKTGKEDASWVASNCNNQLVVNGALTAKEVEFLRTPGDVSTPASTPAEVVNFTPEMVAGNPFFSAASPGTPVIQSLTSLPPVL